MFLCEGLRCRIAPEHARGIKASFNVKNEGAQQRLLEALSFFCVPCYVPARARVSMACCVPARARVCHIACCAHARAGKGSGQSL